jgi:ferric-dicitrate binding protein FerR (iron transport regulator)
MDNINYKTLLDFSKGKYSYNEYLKVKHWFTNVMDDVKVEEQLFDQFKGYADSANMKSLHPIFEKIQYQILLEEKRNQKKRNIWHYYRQVAAVLIPLIAISASLYFFTKPSQTNAQAWLEINVPEGARIEFLLPDSTSGWLNSGAKLKYPAEFTRNRKVELVGEAFFKVKHIEHSDFTVGVKDMDIKVLGTKFNVAAYANEAVTEVVLKEGKVEINGTTATFSHTLHPGEKISYNHETSSINSTVVDPNVYSAWTNGYLVIDNEPLSQAVKKLERWYSAEITIQSDALKKFRFKATFKEETLDEVLRFITMTTPITYKIENRNQSSSGILIKKKVTIKLKR